MTVHASDVSRAITVLLEDTMLSFDFPFYPGPNIPTPHNRQFLRAIKEMDGLVYDLIADRREHPRKVNDLLNLLLLARDPETGERMPDKQLRDEVMTLFIAGHDTTAVTLSWAWYLLSQHPESEARLHAELDRVLGERVPTVCASPQTPVSCLSRSSRFGPGTASG